MDASLKEETPELSDGDGETKSESLRKLIKDALSNDKVTIQVQSLKSGSEGPAALILLPEQMRRMNDIGALMDQRLPGLPDYHVLLVNQKHPLVEGLLKLQAGGVIVGDVGQSPSEVLARDLAQHLYETAKLSVGGLDPKELASFQTNNMQLMSRLMERGF